MQSPQPLLMNNAHFKVDPRLTALLGDNYRSSELAIKELIDNAWDAEATEVKVYLPGVMTDQPILIADNGAGMKTEELRQEYLNIASPRFTRKGERTPNKQRVVKGRKGIGKFAGLILANVMELETRAKGVSTWVQISKPDLLKAGADLEQVPLPLRTEPADDGAHGTTITLRHLNQNLTFPKAEKLREILATDYGKEPDFAVYVNGERVFRHDVQGAQFEKSFALPNGQSATFKYTITEKPMPASKAGIVLRAGGKTVGRAHLYGLEGDDTLSDRLRRRVVGEVQVSGDAIELTAAGGDVIESDRGFAELCKLIPDEVRASLAATHTNEVNLAKGRWAQQMKRRLASVPEHRRAIVEERLEKLISRSYQEGEKEDRISTLIDLVLDAMEMDEYWSVCREIGEAEKVDVIHFAGALEKFGLCDLAFIGIQARRRLEFLDFLDRLARTDGTTERQMHVALQNNLWVFGNEYSLVASNQQLRTIIADYSGSNAADRPDLFLGANVVRQHLLIEFKRPSLPVGRTAEAQAKTYADAITGHLGLPVDIIVIGGHVDTKLQDEYTGKKTKFLAYAAVFALARTQLEWLLEQLSQKPD